MKRFLLFIAPLLLLPTLALACLNDRHTQLAEQEFRSPYEPTQPFTAAATETQIQNPTSLESHYIPQPAGILAALLGLAFITLACRIAYRRLKNPRLYFKKSARSFLFESIAIFLILFFLVMCAGGAPFLSPLHQTTYYPLAYQLPRIKNSTSLRIAMIHDILHERYLRHGPAWYQQSIRDAEQTLEQERTTPASLRALSAMDDLAVALERLHQPEKAAAIMQQKFALLESQPWYKTVKPIAPKLFAETADDENAELYAISTVTPLTPEREQIYTAHANLGTFLIHANIQKALTGDPKAQAQLREGLSHIQQSITYNPAAHFGREDWQATTVQHFLASLDHPNLLTQFDILGNPLNFEIPDQSRNLRYARLSTVSMLQDNEISIETRTGERSEIPKLHPESDWLELVQPRHTQPRPFDEPTLAIIGMWTLGGGPSPHFALALAKIAEQIGQNQIAWEAYQRAIELGDNFSPNPGTRVKLVAYCKSRQSQIAAEESKDPAAWSAKILLRHQQELASGQTYQSDYQAYEAQQIAAHIPLDAPDFYKNFFATHPSIATNPGRSDQLELTLYAPIPFLSELPLTLLLTGTLMLASLYSDSIKSKRHHARLIN